MKNIAEYDYPKQYILSEQEGKKIYKTIDEEEESKDIDEYQFSVISTITEKVQNGKRYSQIQHEDERLGWINLEDSIQLFRFKGKSYRFIGDDFEANDINDKLNIVKDFKTHFPDKLLTVKSEIEYKGERLLGVFIKEKFFGFHEEEYFDEMLTCKIDINIDDLNNKEFYKVSKMKEPITDKIVFEKPKLIAVFKDSNIGRVKVNKKESFWVTLDDLEKYLNDIQDSYFHTDENEKYLDDLFYAVEKERTQSKEAVKVVLSAQNFLNSNRIKEKNKRIQVLQNSFNRANEKVKKLEISKENHIDSEEVENLKKENHKLKQDYKLSESRLEHQKDYNRRLEEQRDRYKNRMQDVEAKLKKLKNK